MILNIIFYDIDFNDTFSEIIIFNICDLSILVSLLYEVIKMILFHFFNDFCKSIIESCREIDLLIIIFFKITEFLDSAVMLLNHSIAIFEQRYDLFIHWFSLVLWKWRELFSFARLHTSSAIHHSFNLTSLGGKLSCASPTKIVKTFFCIDLELSRFVGMIVAIQSLSFCWIDLRIFLWS